MGVQSHICNLSSYLVFFKCHHGQLSLAYGHQCRLFLHHCDFHDWPTQHQILHREDKHEGPIQAKPPIDECKFGHLHRRVCHLPGRADHGSLTRERRQ